METFTVDEVSKKNTKECLWVIYRNNVYDLTNFYESHPGGSILLKHAGKDITYILPRVPTHNISMGRIKDILKGRKIGTIKH